MSIAPLDTLPLFTYGTLLDPLFAAAMLEHPVSAEPATLLDHELVTLPGFGFPVVVATEGRQVRGRRSHESGVASHSQGIPEDGRPSVVPFPSSVSYPDWGQTCSERAISR